VTEHFSVVGGLISNWPELNTKSGLDHTMAAQAVVRTAVVDKETHARTQLTDGLPEMPFNDVEDCGVRGQCPHPVVISGQNLVQIHQPGLLGELALRAPDVVSP